MSTTSAPASDPKPRVQHFRAYSGRIIRMVEAQHRISTDRLTDGPAEQDVLEGLVEEVKPTIPPAARRLHHLLATPFRYGHARETRFRRAHERPGIFYASETQPTAVAETAYWRMRFFAASPGVKLPTATVEYLAFSVAVRAERSLDLTVRPLSTGRKLWTHPTDYSSCQRFAAEARALDTQLIRYESVRDPDHRASIAFLDPAAFREKVPRAEHTWHFRFRGQCQTAFAAAPSMERYDFTFGEFGLAAP